MPKTQVESPINPRENAPVQGDEQVLAQLEELRVPVVALEWLHPVFVAGHWTPQIIELAGGADVLGFAGEHSEQSTWETVAAASPEVVVVMPCGFDARARTTRRWARRGPRADRRAADRRRGRVVLLLAPRTAARRRARAHGAHPAPGPRPRGAGRRARRRRLTPMPLPPAAKMPPAIATTASTPASAKPSARERRRSA